MTKYMKSIYFTVSGDTTVDLPIPLEVEGYVCGVIEMSGKIITTFKGDLFLCSDICEESVVGDIVLPVLRNILRRGNGVVINDINHVIWLKVMRPHISNIRFYISNAKGDIMTFKDSKLKCTLLFIPPE